MKLLKFKWLHIFLLGVLFLACEIDHGLEPIRSSIQGTIRYTGTWPGIPTEVRLVAAQKFPPSDISELIIGESVPFQADAYQYQFYLKPGTYNVLGVVWREAASTWDLISICGLYFVGSDSLAPGKVVISSDTATVKGIDIAVNRSKARRITRSKIVGTIKFQGAWPDSIENAYVVASTRKLTLFPSLKLPTLLDLSFSGRIDPPTDSLQYSINAFTGTYYTTGVIFFRKNASLSADDIFYSGRVGGLNFNVYQVLPDSTTPGPTFQIKF